MPVTVCPTFILLSPRTNKLHSFQTGINMVKSAIKTCKQDDVKEEFLIDLDAAIKENELTLGSLS